MEHSTDGTRRTRVYYCDPMQSGQKGTLENKHIELRYILPKGTDLRALGLTDQTALNLALCHVNSAPVEVLGGKTPLELTDFLYHDLYEKLYDFGIQPIPRDHVSFKTVPVKKEVKKTTGGCHPLPILTNSKWILVLHLKNHDRNPLFCHAKKEEETAVNLLFLFLL